MALVLGQGFWANSQELVLPSHDVPPPEVASALITREPRAGLFKLGPFEVTPRISGSAYYDDNVNTSAEDKQDDFAFTISPGIMALARDVAEDGQGKTFTVDYAPTFLFYTDQSSYNEVNQAARLSGQLDLAKLSLGFGQGFVYSTDPVVDVGQRTDRLSYDTLLNSRYPLAERLSLDLNGTFRLEDYDEFNSYWDLASQAYVNYLYSPKLTLGLGLVVGYTAVDNYPDQSYQQVRFRGLYAVAEKVDLSASVGGEWRQYRGGVDDTLDPVWDISVSYAPREGTSLNLATYQRYSSSSYYGDENYFSTGVVLSARQMLLQRLALNFAFTYYHADYEPTVVGVTSDRVDDVFLVRVSLDTYLRPRWTIGIFYDHETNDSTIDSFTWNRNRVGIQTAWSY